MNDIHQKRAETLKKLRYEHGGTRPDLALLTGLHVNTVENAENANNDPRFSTVVGLLNAYGYKLDLVKA